MIWIITESDETLRFVVGVLFSILVALTSSRSSRIQRVVEKYLEVHDSERKRGDVYGFVALEKSGFTTLKTNSEAKAVLRAVECHHIEHPWSSPGYFPEKHPLSFFRDAASAGVELKDFSTLIAFQVDRAHFKRKRRSLPR